MWIHRSLFKYCKYFLLACTIALFCLWSFGLPAHGQTKESAKVTIDGRVLFSLSPLEDYTAKERVSYTNSVLQKLAASQKQVSFIAEGGDFQATITAKSTSTQQEESQLVLTVTTEDVLLGISPISQAQKWVLTLQEALLRAKYERTWEYLLPQMYIAGISIIVLLLCNVFYYGINQRVIKRSSSRSQRSQTIRVFLIPLVSWLVFLYFISDRFYFLRNGRLVVFTLFSPLLKFQTPLLIVSLILSIFLGKFTAQVLAFCVKRFTPDEAEAIRIRILQPCNQPLRILGTLLLASWSLLWIQGTLSFLYGLLKPIADMAITISLGWTTSRLFSQYLRVYGVHLSHKIGREGDEFVLVGETIANTAIVFICMISFARIQGFDLVGLVASLGLVGLAVAFAAQKILEQLLSTLVLYLDRPFVPGDYIRLPDGQLGRVEAIGLRSTKIRTLAKSTLVIIPNSTLVNIEIENVTMAKKVMVLLYLDFSQHLEEKEIALIKQSFEESVTNLAGIDPGSTSIVTLDDQATRLRVSFIILGSHDNALALRKRLLESSQEQLARQFHSHGITFKMHEPTIYVESPVTI